MKAAVVRSRGADPEIEDWPDPQLGDQQAVGRLVASALNPLDLLIVSGKHPVRHPDPPFIAGYEAVVEADDGQRKYVSAPQPPSGTLAELVPYDPALAFDVPSNLDPGLVCALGLSGLAAWMALENRGGLARGETVVVLGAAGQVGQLALQFARLLGAGQIIAAARSTQLAELPIEGVVGAALDDHAGFSAALGAAAPSGCDVILDLLWGEPAIQAMTQAADGARLVQVGNSASPTAEIPALALRDRGISVIGHSVPLAPVAERQAAFVNLLKKAEELTVALQRTRLEDIAQTWARLRQRETKGKLIVCP